KNKTFFMVSFEGLRQRQDLILNSLVLSDAQRAAVTNPVVSRLIRFIPRANLFDSAGTPRYSGSIAGPVNVDQEALDVSHSFNNNDRLHGYYAIQDANIVQPSLLGNTIPNFGHYFRVRRQFFSLNETHT